MGREEFGQPLIRHPAARIFDHENHSILLLRQPELNLAWPITNGIEAVLDEVRDRPEKPVAVAHDQRWRGHLANETDAASPKDLRTAANLVDDGRKIDRLDLPFLEGHEVRERVHRLLQPIHLSCNLPARLVEQPRQLRIVALGGRLELLHPQPHRRQRVLHLVRHDSRHLVELLHPIGTNQVGDIVHHRNKSTGAIREGHFRDTDPPGHIASWDRLHRSRRRSTNAGALDNRVQLLEEDIAVLLLKSVGAGVGKTFGPIRLEHNHRGFQSFERDPQQFFLVPQAEFALLNDLIHRAHSVEDLGQVRLAGASNRPDRLAVEQSARQRNKLAQGAAQPRLDPGGENHRQEGREQGTREQPVHGPQIRSDSNRVGTVEMEEQPPPLKIHRSRRDQPVVPAKDHRVVSTDQKRRKRTRLRQLRQSAHAHQIRTGRRHQADSLPQRDLTTPTGRQPMC